MGYGPKDTKLDLYEFSFFEWSELHGSLREIISDAESGNDVAQTLLKGLQDTLSQYTPPEEDEE